MGGNCDGHCLAYSCGDPGSGGGSPRGGRGPGSPLASRPVRGQRFVSKGGWGGPRNHCEDACRRGNGHGGLDDELGSGETFVAGRLESKLSVVTWNCATLFGAAPRTREQRRRHAAKIDRVVSFSCRYDVVMLQEVHGNEQDIGELASRIPRHYMLDSFCRDSSSGGVLVIISEELRGRFASCRGEE